MNPLEFIPWTLCKIVNRQKETSARERMNESGRQTNTFIQTSPLPLHSLCHWGLERGDGRLTRGVDLGHFAFWDGINPLMPSSIRLPAPLGTIGKQIFIGLLEKKKKKPNGFYWNGWIFSFSDIFLCVLLCAIWVNFPFQRKPRQRFLLFMLMCDEM